MQVSLKLYNTLSRQVQEFVPMNPPFVGIYVCGPTVYGHPHLGHVRGPIVFDVLRRFLISQGYKVRFVRNITDVGHLVNDADEGEDKIARKALLEKLEPMEVAQFYSDSYTECMRLMNIVRPSIEPRASGHILEQIEMIEKLIAAGLAYAVNGSVYFNVLKYAESHNYGELSGRVLEDLQAGASVRTLEGQDEKLNPNDFALWKKAEPQHIMKWHSPWSEGFPGWHIECSAMSAKYLGETFDIHGGGMDLLFPHHESEIAQSTGCFGHNPANLWMHHNMVTINGQKMAKSLDNGIQITELFSGNHRLLDQAFSPMTLRFFILQAHYRGTLDFSNDALKAAEKGLKRLMEAEKLLQKIEPSADSSFSVSDFENRFYAALSDDMNTPVLIAELFDAVRMINLINDKGQSLNAADLLKLRNLFQLFLFDILGMQKESSGESQHTDGLVNILIEMRQQAKLDKNYALSDEIRDKLIALGINLKDGKEGTTWSAN